jgi:hypothetical protein
MSCNTPLKYHSSDDEWSDDSRFPYKIFRALSDIRAQILALQLGQTSLTASSPSILNTGPWNQTVFTFTNTASLPAASVNFTATRSNMLCLIYTKCNPGNAYTSSFSLALTFTCNGGTIVATYSNRAIYNFIYTAPGNYTPEAESTTMINLSNLIPNTQYTLSLTGQVENGLGPNTVNIYSEANLFL